VDIAEFKNVSSQERTIQVTGSADMTVEPDEVEFNIGIQQYFIEEFQEGKKYEDYKTLAPLQPIEDELMNRLHAFGISKNDITIENAGSYWRQSGKMAQMSKHYSIKLTDLSLIEKMVVSFHFNGLEYMSIGELKNKKLHDFRKQVKTEALKAAKEKAGYLAESMGKKLGEVISIKEGSGDNAYSGFWGGSSSAMSNTSLSSGQSAGETNLRKITLKYEILAVFEIK
jgi:uncharacterized protein YggE